MFPQKSSWILRSTFYMNPGAGASHDDPTGLPPVAGGPHEHAALHDALPAVRGRSLRHQQDGPPEPCRVHGPQPSLRTWQVLLARYQVSTISIFFRLLLLGVATKEFPSPFCSIICIVLYHFNHCHVLSHRIRKPPFRPSLFPLSRPVS